MAIFPIYDRKLGIEYNYYLLLQTNICLTALARLEQAQCLFSGVQTTVCAQASAETLWNLRGGTSFTV